MIAIFGESVFGILDNDNDNDKETTMSAKLIQAFNAISELYFNLVDVAPAEGRTPDSYTLAELIELAQFRLAEFRPESGNELAEGLLGQCDAEFNKYARDQYKQIRAWLAKASKAVKV